ncbi:hydroxycarboxylic acid receptor 2-like isoform X2 [Siniperca chuatsi]|uniref:hydroxycarboxylic acid receptor 2-like isoform X2 n=1 Tax=Siniperca chuatsi TaxID=119488 RepID=UPI001CE051A9|nr:hydroxycarboxylic acid receptor 2-like isoform X2 [Siniperca chuatsi]
MQTEQNENFTTAVLNLTTPSPGGGGGGGGGCPPVGIQLEGVILPPVLTIDVILGLLGNLVALWIFCFKLKAWNPNNLFLFNLVIADFLALVVHPHHRFNRMSKQQAVFVSAFVWLLVISPRVPMLAYNHIKGSGNRTQCFFFTSYKEASRAIIILVGMHRILTVLEFIIPMAMLLFCSIRISSFLKKRQMGKADKVRKAMRVCAIIVAVFMVCFLPTTVTTIGVWAIRSYRPWDCASFYTFTQLTIVSLGLNFLNSAMDPIVYVFSSSMFRKALCSSLPRALRCGQDAGDGENTASSSGNQSTTQQELKSLRADRGSEAK